VRAGLATPMSPATFNRSTNPSKTDYDEFVTWLSRTTLAELRATHGDMKATREDLLRFFRRGVKAELLLDELMQILFFQPTRAGSIFSRVWYNEQQAQFIIQMVKAFTLADIGAPSDGQGPASKTNPAWS